MKPVCVVVCLLSVIFFLSVSVSIFSQQTNFSIAPAPVPWPYFDDGRTDLCPSGSFVRITAQDVTLTGALADVKARQAFSGLFALDINGGFGGLAGKMPGIPPVSTIYTSGKYSYVPYFTKATGDATATFLNLNASTNLELQPVRTEHFDIIIFGGAAFSYSSLTISTPYALIVPPPYANAGETFTGYTDKLTVTMTTYGYQCGIQCDVALDDTLRISPFFMMTSMRGTASFVDNPGTARYSAASYSANIPQSTSYSFGLDIIVGDFSIGTMLQQMQSAGKQDKNTNMVMVTASYHIPSDTGEPKKDPGTAAEGE